MPPVTVHPPPTSGSSNGSSRNDATTETGPQPIPERPRKRRGPTQGFQTAHIVKVTQHKLEVIIEKEDMRATGPNAPRFANEIGAAVRQYAPLNKIWWKDVTDAEKSPMYSRLENVFVLDYDKRPWIKEVIENDMPIRFKEFRYELHDYYETLIDLPMAERKAKKHDQVLNQDYWDFLCDYWESEAFKKKSKRNATNRSKLTHGHCSGSRSFLNTQAMGDTGNGRPDRIDLWKITHYKQGKGWIAQIAEKKYDDMVTLLSSQQHTDNEGQSDDGGDRPQVLTPDDVANEILGTRSSYYIGLGRGPKPPKKTCRASSAQHENVELRQMVQTQQSQLTFAREKIGILEKQNNAIIALLDQLMPGAAEKLTTLTNLASPTPNIADP